VLLTENLSKVYQNKMACQDICLSVKEGQVFGLLGLNGAGKSTLLKMLLGLVRPSSGKAQVMGRRAGDIEVRYKTGYLPEMFRFYDWLSGWELLSFYARLYQIPVQEEKTAIYEVLELVGLQGQEKYKIKTYSKGMQQRLGLARAVLHKPALVLLDEPTSALDPLGRKDVRDTIKRLQERGTTIFLNSHLLGEVEMTCSHLGFIKQGRLIACGPMDSFGSSESEITIEVEHLDPAILKNRQGCTINKDGLLQFKVMNRQEVPLIVSEIVQAGGQVYRVESKNRSLEQVFIELMGE
jgi:ABC-2 type transport system ATP-binding protein